MFLHLFPFTIHHSVFNVQCSMFNVQCSFFPADTGQKQFSAYGMTGEGREPVECRDGVQKMSFFGIPQDRNHPDA
jgi:hypothetical protein